MDFIRHIYRYHTIFNSLSHILTKLLRISKNDITNASSSSDFGFKNRYKDESFDSVILPEKI